VVRAATADGGRLIRLKDVARVELGSQTYSQTFRLDGKPAAGIAIYLTPAANALAVARLVKEKMAELSHDFPPGLAYAIPFDTTTFVETSIDEVYVTLAEAGVLVLIVILAFLQDWRASLVPATTIPVTIIGAFAAMAARGFSVNLSPVRSSASRGFRPHLSPMKTKVTGWSPCNFRTVPHRSVRKRRWGRPHVSPASSPVSPR
jgi:HAE1 family hydrophobic/amphiphilic exporter-1